MQTPALMRTAYPPLPTPVYVNSGLAQPQKHQVRDVHNANDKPHQQPGNGQPPRIRHVDASREGDAAGERSPLVVRVEHIPRHARLDCHETASSGKVDQGQRDEWQHAAEHHLRPGQGGIQSRPPHRRSDND
ncbi:hypothetical protein ACCO45_009254 [Purpureocillium lilacinum]|uniref:Uncharacterized protein n=1 Tax=Purpureocillium lilacinum TaxID=33203 RepID=A0ACC4DM94_PURLI